MPIVIFLQSVEPASLIVGRVYKVKGVVRDIVYHVSDQEKHPGNRTDDWVLELDQSPDKALHKDIVKYDEQCRRKDESVSEQNDILRIVGKEMVDSVRHEVKIANESVFGYVSFRVENKSVETVLNQAEKEHSEESSQDGSHRVEGFPRRDVVKFVGDHDAGHNRDEIPLVVGETLHDVVAEDARRLHEHPVRRVDYFEVFLVISFPDLIGQGLVVVDESVDLVLEGTDGHAVCHGDGEGMVKRHLLLDVLQVLVLDEESASRVVLEERGAIQDFIVVEDQNFIFLLGVALDLFDTFEFQCVGGASHQFQFKLIEFIDYFTGKAVLAYWS